MEQYKEKLKVSQRIYTVAAVLLMIFSILFLLSECGIVNITPVTGDSHWHSRWNGFITGASVGLLIFMIVAIFRNIRAMRNETALKKLYIKDNDERTAEIVKSAQAAAYRTTLYVGLVAVIVAGYFSITVSLTILGCIWIPALLGAAYKFYFSRKI